jgi:hypothetical protein
MRKDHFTDEAVAAAKALAALKYSENPEDQQAFSEAYDFARCQRPDGSFYGTAGTCRKGSPAGAKQEEPKAAKPKAAASEKPKVWKAPNESKPGPVSVGDAAAQKWKSGKHKPRDLATVQTEFKRADKALDGLTARHRTEEAKAGKKMPFSKEWQALDAKRADLYFEREAARKEARKAKKANAKGNG